MDRLKIAKRAVKLNKFKNLMAYTITTAISVWPSAVLAMILPASSPWIVASLIALGVLQVIIPLTQSIVHVETDGRGDGVLGFMLPTFWKKVMEKAILSSVKKANEEVIVKLRELSQKEKLEPKDFEYIAKIKHEQKPFDLSIDALKSLYIHDIGTPSEYNYKKDTKYDIKNSEVTGIFSKVLKKAQTQDDNALSKSVVSEGQKSITRNHLKLNTFAADDDVSFHEINSQNSLILNGPDFTGLSEKNYNEIKAIFKSENKKSIKKLLAFLHSTPSDKEGLINWVKIKEIMDTNYKSTAEYDFFASIIDEHIIKQLSHEQRDEIISKIESNEPTIVAETENSTSKTVNTPSHKKCIFIGFNSTLFSAQWQELKHQYDVFYNLKGQHAPERFLELNSYLNTMLPMLIKAEEGLSKMDPKTNTDDEKSLMINNLNLVTNRIKTLNLEAKELINKDLSVAHLYHQKTMSTGKR